MSQLGATFTNLRSPKSQSLHHHRIQFRYSLFETVPQVSSEHSPIYLPFSQSTTHSSQLFHSCSSSQPGASCYLGHSGDYASILEQTSFYSKRGCCEGCRQPSHRLFLWCSCIRGLEILFCFESLMSFRILLLYQSELFIILNGTCYTRQKTKNKENPGLPPPSETQRNTHLKKEAPRSLPEKST
ncbi:hypothetical protein FGO68_gene10506 [Halteria grandinella]|uniref:Uncharacterized protein n=1 Tax=Halteria grandinella TaxID=5974 RepID=A0A8J8NDB8_HALGN|nr:hypothetical protein FGO68_gene10506 [Halteria grandinella]